MKSWRKISAMEQEVLLPPAPSYRDQVGTSSVTKHLRECSARWSCSHRAAQASFFFFFSEHFPGVNTAQLSWGPVLRAGVKSYTLCSVRQHMNVNSRLQNSGRRIN